MKPFLCKSSKWGLLTSLIVILAFLVPPIARKNEDRARLAVLKTFVAHFSRKIAATHNWQLVNWDIPYEGKVDEIEMSFRCQQLLDAEEAEEILLVICEKLLEEMNTSPKLRPHLAHYPFEASDLLVGVTFGIDPIPIDSLEHCSMLTGEFLFFYLNEYSEGKYKHTTENYQQRTTWEEAIQRRNAKYLHAANAL